MKWEADEDNPEIQLLVGRDQDNEPIELGRVEPGTQGFWRWSGTFVMGCGGCQSQSGAMRQLVEELGATRDMLLFNLGDGVD
jgi:hypothetical protein